MNAIAAASIVSACVFSGAVAGLNAHRFLPGHHLTRETQDVVRLATGTISVLASLVLGLLIATAKTASDTTDREMRGYAADLIALDSTLRKYGPDAAAPRALLQRSAQRFLQDVWPAGHGRRAGLEEASVGLLLGQVEETVRALVPADPAQRWRQDQAMETITSLIRQRWLLIEQSGSTVQPVIVATLVSWVVAIFFSFGLNAPRNGTIAAAFLVCSLAIGAAVFLVLEMDSPFDGVLRISERPMQRALAYMER